MAKMIREPLELPVPFYRPPNFAAPGPAWALYVPHHGPLYGPADRDPQLRGFGPADSVLMRIAITTGLFDPATLFLSPLIPSPGNTAASSVDLDRDASSAPLPELVADFAYRTPQALFLGETKPSAGYVALGQALTYAHWYCASCRPQERVIPAILTDYPKSYLPAVAAKLGVRIFDLGQCCYEPPTYPT